jgi:hypothetical protein
MFWSKVRPCVRHSTVWRHHLHYIRKYYSHIVRAARVRIPQTNRYRSLPGRDLSTPDLITVILQGRVIRDKACRRNWRLAPIILDLPTNATRLRGIKLYSRQGHTERGTTSANQRANITAKPPFASAATTIGHERLTFCDTHEASTP